MHFIFASVQMFYSFIMVASGYSLAFFPLIRYLKVPKTVILIISFLIRLRVLCDFHKP